MTIWALQKSKNLISNVAGWLQHLSNSVQQVHKDTHNCRVGRLTATVHTMTTCPPECVYQKDWPCCVIEAADSILMAVLGQPTWATVLGGLVTEFSSIAFLTGPGLTHTPTARPVVTHPMDTATICQERSDLKPPHQWGFVDSHLSFTVPCDISWSSQFLTEGCQLRDIHQNMAREQTLGLPGSKRFLKTGSNLDHQTQGPC